MICLLSRNFPEPQPANELIDPVSNQPIESDVEIHLKISQPAKKTCIGWCYIYLYESGSNISQANGANSINEVVSYR